MFKSKYRGRKAIIADILKSTCSRRKGARKTNIVQSANLNTAMFERYIEFLIQNGLVILEDSVYRATKKGRALVGNGISDVMEVSRNF